MEIQINYDSLESLEAIAKSLRCEAENIMSYNGGLDGSSTDGFARTLFGNAALLDAFVRDARNYNK
jgi:hypothetical protein